MFVTKAWGKAPQGTKEPGYYVCKLMWKYHTKLNTNLK